MRETMSSLALRPHTLQDMVNPFRASVGGTDQVTVSFHVAMSLFSHKQLQRCEESVDGYLCE